jgi:hypothetical protein
MSEIIQFILKWKECMWILKIEGDEEFDSLPQNILVGDILLSTRALYSGYAKLGEAGNSAYPPSCFPRAMRIGDEVLITSKTANDLFPKKNGVTSIILPASTKFSGCESCNGKTLGEIMREGVLYNYAMVEC